MAGLSFDITGNNENFLRKLEETKRGVAEAAKFMGSQSKGMDSAFNSVSFGDTLKKQIYEGSQSINGLTAQIIKQKGVIKDIEQDVRNLGEAYRRAGAGTSKGNALFADFKSAKSALQEEKSALFDLQTQQAQARLSVRKLKDEYSLYQKEGQNVVESNEKMALSFKKTLAAIGGTAMIKKFVSDVIRVRGEFQQLEIAFETMLKSKEKSSALMAQLTETAAKTPFDLQSVSQGAKQLLAYGTASEEVNDTLIRLGNIASGLSIPLGDLVYLYGTTQTQGRLFTQDVRQFMGRGIPLVKELADELGKTEQQINEMVTAGQIGFPQVEKVIRNMTSENGQFYNLMEKQSASLTGQISNLGDAWDGMLNKIGTQTQGIASAGISAVTSLIENYEEIGVVLASLAASYGTYKAAIIIVNTLEKANIMIMRQAIIEKKLATASNITLSNSMAIAAARGKMFALVQRNIMSSLKGIGSTLANPYVLLGAAVGAATYGLYKFYTRETEVEQMQRQYNETKAAAAKREEEHKAKIDELISSIENEITAEMDRVGAMETLKKLYPDIIEKYINEEGHLRNIIALKKELAEFDAKKKVEQNKTELQSYDERIKNQEEYIDQMRTNDQSAFDDEVAKLNELKRQRELSRTNVASDYINKAINEAKSMSDADITNAINTYQKALADNKNGEWFDTDREFKVDEVNRYISALKNLQTTRATAVHDKEYWENLKKETQSQLDALTNIEASGKKGAALKQKIAEYDKKINSFSASNTTKQENQAAKAAETLRQQQEKYSLLMDKQTRDRVRAEEDAANEIRQAKIDADKDGAEKVLKQRELNHDKEIQAIAREADDRKRAVIDAGRSAFESAEDKAKAEDPKHVKKTFDEKKFVKSDDAQKEFLQINKVAQGKVDAENAKHNRGEDLNGLLDEYQDFADQRLAIEKKFNEDIKVLDAQRKTALENGDMEQVAKIDRSKVQAEKNKKEDLSGVSLEEFKTDIDWATLFGNLDVLSPESLNKLRDKLKAFIETAADKLKPEDLKVLSEAMTNVDLTIADKTPYEALKVGLSGYKVATGDAATAQEKLNKLQKDGKDGTQEYKDATKELTDAQRRRAESLKTVTQAANNIGSKGMEVVNAGNEIVGMLENFGVEVPEAVGKTLDGIGQVMSGLESLDLTKPFTAITGAISILSGIGNTIAGLLGFGKENKTLKDTQRLEEITNRLAETEKVINSFIEKRIELLKAANVEEQKNISATTQTAIDNQKKYYEQQLDGLEGNWLLAKAGKNNNLTLEDLGITSIKELEEFLSSDRLLELQKNGYSIRDAEKWQEIIDGNNSLLDSEKELQEVMAKNRTGISLDEAQNALDDFIKDADSSFGDVADSFEDHMRDAMFNIVKQNYLNKALEDWYKDFEEAMSDGELSKAEAEKSKKKYEDAYTGAQERYLSALEAAGISAESDPSREATQKGIATASQDSVDENNGRLTVIQGHTYSINESVTSINGNTAKIVENLACMTNISQSMKSILDMKDIELKHLSDISRHTENLVEMKQFMYSMKQGIDTLNTKGLTLKR